MKEQLRSEFVRALFRIREIKLKMPSGMDMKMSEMVVLRRIAEDAGEGVNWMDDVRANLCVSKPAISHILNSLEKKGRVVREIDKNDRRKIVIRITDEGRRVVDMMRKRSDRMTDEIIKRFGEDNAEQFITLVNRFAEVFADINLKSCKEGDGVID